MSYWTLQCLKCDLITDDLVVMQEHSMNFHGATHDDVRNVIRVKFDDRHYKFTSPNGLLKFEATKKKGSE